MNIEIIDNFYGRWVRVGPFLENLSSLEAGFKDREKNRRGIWDYIEWRETVLVGSPDPSCRTAALI